VRVVCVCVFVYMMDILLLATAFFSYLIYSHRFHGN